jgi:hypothetical protein
MYGCTVRVKLCNSATTVSRSRDGSLTVKPAVVRMPIDVGKASRPGLCARERLHALAIAGNVFGGVVDRVENQNNARRSNAFAALDGAKRAELARLAVVEQGKVALPQADHGLARAVSHQDVEDDMMLGLVGALALLMGARGQCG